MVILENASQFKLAKSTANIPWVKSAHDPTSKFCVAVFLLSFMLTFVTYK